MHDLKASSFNTGFCVREKKKKKKAKGRGKSPLATGMKERDIFKVLKDKYKPSIWNSQKTSHMSVTNFF